mmetsp:Transcript_24763/g.38587  ORF Transcript_24763/g.38587 Transcript_24763/m.38587 type:complete len:224 (-) Transcript_24763:92-763(-)|eukprot:CAMPEP_0201522744 /NCGR_PEP_ID=MMETSP0161_2-20130828/18525_1 /ASSEMBLY_ACC=CAM_ASM_000251 /TAXON_ID=180227 /ORGANISM="Neoparamoeba aestuarina, Strain SoJaBio B1-5/56/2" /LENGTH=223 /DNA_ID=CAMNT_0047921671 /DNA_START=30 /DNA_END=701 /DNA_ORIENTATION=-
MPLSATVLLGMIDSFTGKVDKSTLSQKTLMELFIQGIDNKERVCGSAADPKDISEWSNVVFNDNLEIIEINWSLDDLNGSIATEWLPATLQKLMITSDFLAEHWLRGTVDLTVLPDALTYLNLSENNLNGTISLTSLPPRMEFLDISQNGLNGPLDLTKLPSTLEVLNLAWNSFSGVTDFSRLPESLKELSLLKNELEGTIHVRISKLHCRVLGTRIVVKKVK